MAFAQNRAAPRKASQLLKDCYAQEHGFASCATPDLRLYPKGSMELSVSSGCAKLSLRGSYGVAYDSCINQGLNYIVRNASSNMSSQQKHVELIRTACMTLSLNDIYIDSKDELDKEQKKQKELSKRTAARLLCYYEMADNAGGRVNQFIKNIGDSPLNGYCSPAKYSKEHNGAAPSNIETEKCFYDMLYNELVPYVQGIQRSTPLWKGLGRSR